MVISMTGYGRGELTAQGRNITVEIKSVNNRYFDCSVRIPRVYLFLEEKIKSLLQQDVARGKIDVYITLDGQETAPAQISINRAMAEGYCNAYAQLSELFQIPNDLSSSILANLPEVLVLEKTPEDVDSIGEDILSVVKIAMEDFGRMRRNEGEKLRLDLLEHSATIEDLLEKIELRSPDSIREYEERLMLRMKEVLGNQSFDENRILTEVALFSDKVSVAEETVRLRSHLAQLREMLEDGGAIGRKIDFLIQEFNRETNTIGSKCSDIELSRYVVDMKAEIEKMREQTQNIE